MLIVLLDSAQNVEMKGEEEMQIYFVLRRKRSEGKSKIKQHAWETFDVDRDKYGLSIECSLSSSDLWYVAIEPIALVRTLWLLEDMIDIDKDLDITLKQKGIIELSGKNYPPYFIAVLRLISFVFGVEIIGDAEHVVTCKGLEYYPKPMYATEEE